MKTSKDVIKILAQTKPELARKFRVTRLALFGSYARGDYSQHSDVDVLVDVDPSIGLEFVSLANRIEQALGLHADVVSRRAISPRHWEVIRHELIDV